MFQRGDRLGANRFGNTAATAKRDIRFDDNAVTHSPTSRAYPGVTLSSRR